jgi:integrase
MKTHSRRTAYNWGIRVNAYLRWAGEPTVLTRVLPRYCEPLPDIYSDAEVQALTTNILFATLLCCGLRMSEAKYAERRDLSNGCIRITDKPKYAFTTKTWENLIVPVPRWLYEQLALRPSGLLFGTRTGNPDRHMLRTLKRHAQRVGLDPTGCTLHRFRRTYATKLLRSGMDLRTVMRLCGWSDMETVLRYWRPVELDQLAPRIEAVFARLPTPMRVAEWQPWTSWQP